MPPRDYYKEKKSGRFEYEKPEKVIQVDTMGSKEPETDKEWGYFDSLAKASNPNTSVTEQEKAIKQAKSIANSRGWNKEDSQGSIYHQQAIINANRMHAGKLTAGQIRSETDPDWWRVDQDGTTGTTTAVTDEDEKDDDDLIKKKKTYTVGSGTTKMQVSKKLYNYYQHLLNNGYSIEKAIDIIRLGKIEEEWADKNLQTLSKKIGGISEIPSGIGLVAGMLKNQPYENKFLGSAGAAAILNKLNNLPVEDKKDYINNILAKNKGAYEIFGDKLKTGLSVEEFEKGLVNANQGNKNFDKIYHKTSGDFWSLNPPTTQGGMEDLANASRQEGFEWTKQNTQMVQQARDIADKVAELPTTFRGLPSLSRDGETQPVDPPVDPTDPDAGMMPSGTYLASQYNKALMPDPNMDPYKNAMYTTGIEQQHIAGGYWDPNTHQWVGSPWGTQNLWQGANPTSPEVTTMAEGGPVRAPSSKVTNGGGGLFNFKAYGF